MTAEIVALAQAAAAVPLEHHPRLVFGQTVIAPWACWFQWWSAFCLAIQAVAVAETPIECGRCPPLYVVWTEKGLVFVAKVSMAVLAIILAGRGMAVFQNDDINILALYLALAMSTWQTAMIARLLRRWYCRRREGRELLEHDAERATDIAAYDKFPHLSL